MIPADFLEILRCPATHQRLRLASPQELAAAGEGLTAGLVREDGAALYPIENEIPILLVESAIPLPRPT